jgi:ribosomal protein S18 acetylase RimI-like enzyme
MSARAKSTPAPQLRIEEVDLNSPLLDEVIKLHAAGKARLGPFPQGAFEDHARQKKIFAAVTSENEVAGYLLYRVAKSARKNRASIVHLTTSTSFRGQGVARLLVDCLKAKTHHLLGISLRCRRDYNINDMWQGFGFTVRHSKAGRGADGAPLDYWWFGHQHDDLFSHAASQDDESERILIAIDANVFYDLTCDGRPHSEDTRVLQADWR